MAEREGIYISQLPESTSLTDNMLFATDNGADNNSVSAANLAEYVNNKIDVAGQVNNGVSEANSYTDTKKTEAVTEANSYSDTKKTEAVSETKEWAQGTFSNPNYLINSNFVKPVNQRGETIYNSNNNYSIDRWRIRGGGELVLGDGNIILNRKNNGDYNLIEQTIEDYEALKGEKITLTINIDTISSGDQIFFFINFGTSTFQSKYFISTGIYHTTITVPSDANAVIVRVCSGTINVAKEICRVKWIKLELGEVATPFVPRPYAEELALCQRYYQKLNRGGSLYYTVGSDVGRGSTTCYVQKTLSTIMRSIPTVTVNGSWRATMGSSHVVVNSIASDASTNTDILSLRCTLASTISNGSIFVLQGSNDKTANIELDAEIY